VDFIGLATIIPLSDQKLAAKAAVMPQAATNQWTYPTLAGFSARNPNAYNQLEDFATGPPPGASQVEGICLPPSRFALE